MTWGKRIVIIFFGFVVPLVTTMKAVKVMEL